MENKSMTVGEVIEELKKYPPEFLVVTEGCDCDGDVGEITLEQDYVYLRRP